MATKPASSYGQWFGCARVEHVLMRAWTGLGHPSLIRAECHRSSAVAESVYQRVLRDSSAYAYEPWGCDVLPALADEIASRPSDSTVWRDYADWAWRHDDPRGGLVELHEALDFAPTQPLRARIERDLAAYEHTHFGTWRRELEAAHPTGTLRFRRGLLMGVSGFPCFELPKHAPTAIAELELPLSDGGQLEALAKVLSCRAWQGLVRLTVRLQTPLDDQQGAELLSMIYQRLPRLRELRVRSSSGHVSAGPCTSAALHQLLTRHRDIVCGETLELLHLDIEPPLGTWDFAAAADLIEALGPSGLQELELRASTISEDLRQWARHSGFADRLRRCELLTRSTSSPRTSVARMGPRPKLPAASVTPDAPPFWVWSDWLQARGDTLGELAVTWARLGQSDDPQARAQLRQARARVERELGVDGEDVIACEWSGLLVSRLWVRGRASSSELLLRRALASEACVGLEQLTIEDATSTTMAILGRLSAEPEGNVGAVLRQLGSLQLAGLQPLDIGPALAALPALTRVHCHARAWSLQSRTMHAGIEALECSISTDLDRRACARNFAKLGAELFPNLRELTLDIEARTRGPGLPFDALELASGLHLRIRGQLREADADLLLHRCDRSGLEMLELSEPQPRRIERRVLAAIRRRPRLCPISLTTSAAP